MNETSPTDRMQELLAHSGWVQGLAQRLVRDPGAADDLVQDAWVAAMQKPPASDRPVRGWLAGVVRNLARQRRRSEGRRARRERLVGARRAPLPSTDALAARMETQRDLAEAILGLEEPWRATIILRYLDGLSSAEIAKREGVPASTVRGRVKRALAQLRTALDARHGGDRRAWNLLLLPFLSPPFTGPSAPGPVTAGSASTMGLAAKLTWCVAGLCLLVAALAVTGVLPGFEKDDDAQGPAPVDSATQGEDSEPTLASRGPAAPPGPAVSFAAQLAEAEGALRTLVGHPAWAVNTLRAELATKTMPDGAEDGRAFVASLGEQASIVLGVVHLFGSSDQAEAHVAAARAKVAAQRKRMTEMGLPAETLVVGDGGGTEDALPGFHTRLRLRMMPGEETARDTQLVQLGRFTIRLDILGAPELDRGTQDAAIDHAAAFLRDPLAARGLPVPASKAFDGMGRVLAVRIEGPDGAPVPRVLGLVRKPDGSSLQTTLQGGEGRLALPVKGTAEVFILGAADAEGAPLPFGPVGPRLVRPGETQLHVQLEPGLVIAGTLLDAEGKPAEGIQVEARLGKGPGAPVEAGPRAPSPERIWTRVAPDPYTTTRSASDGTFRLVGLVKGAYRLRFLRGDVVATSEEPMFEAGRTDIRIELRPTKAFRLTVVDPDGAPVPGATVSLRAEGRLPVRTTTDAEGVATLVGLDASRTYTLWVFGPGDSLGSVGYENWRPADKTIRLEGVWRLRGVVQDAEGRPLRAWVYRDDGSGQQTEADGTFEIHELPRGPVRIAAVALGSWARPPASAWRTLGPTEERVALTIKRPLLSVRVTGPKGEPVPHAYLGVHMLDASGRTRDVFVEEVEDGVWRGKHPGGAFALEVYQAASDQRVSLGYAPVYREKLGGADREIVISLTPGGRVSGRVLDAKGKPMVDLPLGAIPAGLDVDPAEASLVSSAHAWTRTAEDGTFELRGLGAGGYAIWLDLPASVAAPKPVHVVAGTRDVEIVLPAR